MNSERKATAAIVLVGGSLGLIGGTLLFNHGRLSDCGTGTGTSATQPCHVGGGGHAGWFGRAGTGSSSGTSQTASRGGFGGAGEAAGGHGGGGGE